MMCLLSTAGSNPPGPSNNTATYSPYQSLDSPCSSSSSDSSSCASNSDSDPKSPPQLSPQNPIFVKLDGDKPSNDSFMLNTPPMSLLTPQNKENESKDELKTDEINAISNPLKVEEQSRAPLKTVPFTFCNMRPNIFDIKKKRGRKKNRKNSSTNGNESTATLFSLSNNETTNNIPSEAVDNESFYVENPCPLLKRKYSSEIRKILFIDTYILHT